jgi:hypothetical protein
MVPAGCGEFNPSGSKDSTVASAIAGVQAWRRLAACEVSGPVASVCTTVTIGMVSISASAIVETT